VASLLVSEYKISGDYRWLSNVVLQIEEVDWWLVHNKLKGIGDTSDTNYCGSLESALHAPIQSTCPSTVKSQYNICLGTLRFYTLY
jgi:hypothetical protein